MKLRQWTSILKKMEITPRLPNPASLRKSALDDSGPQKATAAEIDASKRIRAADQQVTERQRETEGQLGRMQDEYERQRLAESGREQAALDSERSKGYEQLRELQRVQQNELRKVRREGEDELRKLREHYLFTTNNVRTQGDQELRQSQSQSMQKLDYERKSDEEKNIQLKAMQDQELKNLTDTGEFKLNSISEQNHKREEDLRNQGETQTAGLIQNYVEKLNQTRKDEGQILHQMETEANQKLTQIRQNTAEKLAAYETRHQDPFYRLMDIHARIDESENAFTLTATIPEHEQKNLSVLMKGDRLVLAGYRKNEETLQLEAGHTQGTSSYQTYRESFPLPWPVDARKITREANGDQLIIRIPKKILV